MPREALKREQLSMQDIQLLSWQPAFIAFSFAGLLSLPYSQILMLVPMLQFLFYLFFTWCKSNHTQVCYSIGGKVTRLFTQVTVIIKTLNEQGGIAATIKAFKSA